MIDILFKTRKFEDETYKFYMHLPEYDGEKGICGIEITPYITVDTPENAFGYEDTFFYNEQTKSGYFADRCHPAWIKRKIIEVCNKHFDDVIELYYRGNFAEKYTACSSTEFINNNIQDKEIF